MPSVSVSWPMPLTVMKNSVDKLYEGVAPESEIRMMWEGMPMGSPSSWAWLDGL